MLTMSDCEPTRFPVSPSPTADAPPPAERTPSPCLRQSARGHGTRREEEGCIVGAHQAGAKCRTNRPGSSNAIPPISTAMYHSAATGEARARRRSAAASTQPAARRRRGRHPRKVRTHEERGVGEALQTGAK